MNGRIIRETVGSVVLKNNPLGDPRLREVPVYLPPSYADEPDKKYPVIYYLVGFMGTAQGVIHPHPWKESAVERLDRMIAKAQARECILVIPDCFTLYGGSQYRNSEGTGRYEDHIISELIPYIDSKYRTFKTPAGRAVMGKSSGGYGAMWLGMHYPEVFSHVLCHSGDMFFDMCYGMDFPKCVNALGEYGASMRRFVKEFSAAREKMSFPHALTNLAGMASSYSPNKKNPMGFDIPFDENTGELIWAIWQRWLACDPVHLASKKVSALKKLKTLYFDCGSKDEFYLHLGARKFSQTLKKLKVRHVYEEHGMGHFNMSERYDFAFARLKRAFPKNG